VAFHPMNEIPPEDEREAMERELVIVGLVGMIDPPREEVKVAVAECRTAGIRPIMITGDHPLTAMAIAKELDITRNEQVYTGVQLSKTSPEELREIVKDVSVYARVSPEHKLNIVQALQENGHVSAMTGDGVNDAPALRRADIGVAMGITGTDVSKEAADMVLLDDNFATIVAAVKEGRTIYDNIRKFIKYTLSSNTGELFVMVVAPFLGMPLPLLPTQILWINLVTDGVPGLALAVEEAEKGTMAREPQNPKAGVFADGLGVSILWTGFLMGILSLGVGFWGFMQGYDTAVWRTMVFTTLTLAQMSNALSTRSFRDSLFDLGLFSNRIMTWAIIITFALQIALIYVPFANTFFSTAPLNALQLGICLAVSVLMLVILETVKWFRFRK
ncbi:MAG: HAD-IC family P-type ATPase, partial [Anaerolineales bacterium]|nr:HAD-IC family P-type ATPase [Anaerolineales bacterium]